MASVSILLTLFFVLTISFVHGQVRLDESLLKDSSSDVKIYMASPAAMYDDYDQRSDLTREEKMYKTSQALQTASEASTKDLVPFLRSYGLQVSTYWIVNVICVIGITPAILKLVLTLYSGVVVAILRIGLNPMVPIVETVRPCVTKTWDDANPLESIKLVGAQYLWGKGLTGEKVRVGTIDSGVDREHPDLKENYIGDCCGWFIGAGNISCGGEPADGDLVFGHGTHTMGSLAGQNGIGVAKNAKWLNCLACLTITCPDNFIYGCLQFMLCPDPDKKCSCAPHVLSCSWGSDGSDARFEEAIDKLVSKYIVVVFAIGNAGPACETSGSPGNFPKVIGVGAIARNNTVATFSSCGPVTTTLYDNTIKPDVVSMGVDVISAKASTLALNAHCSDPYQSLSGTSMATPHVAGLAALLLSKCQGASVPPGAIVAVPEVIRLAALYAATTCSLSNPPLTYLLAQNCGQKRTGGNCATPGSTIDYPNYVAGYGATFGDNFAGRAYDLMSLIC